MLIAFHTEIHFYFFFHSSVIHSILNEKGVDSNEQRELFAHHQRIPASKKHYTVTGLQIRFTNGRTVTEEEEKKINQKSRRY